MSIDVVRAWKDVDYRNSLTETEKSQIPDHPSGLIDLTDEEMTIMSGGCPTCGNPFHTPIIQCTPNPWEVVTSDPSV